MIERILEKKNIFIFLILLLVSFTYIIYLNLNIIELNNNIKSKDNLYKIQINNRINEIDQLNSQLTDLHQLLNIGLDLSNKNNIYLNTRINEEDKKFILNSIPSAPPLRKVFITSEFGFRLHPIFRKEKLHTGVDLRAKIGTEVYSTANGVILEARNIDNGGYGKMVRIIHNHGFETLYAHLDDIYVNPGDIIKKGTLIGLTGNTGRSNGPHLHYEVKYIKKYLNPTDFLYWNRKTFDTIFSKNQETIHWKDLIFLMKNDIK
ncbi:zinc metallopeptidase, M23 family [Halarcobacter anaerophilus]|nr:zinc metallopeptidase, M23 family [Halarcobacter anaerophilus]